MRVLFCCSAALAIGAIAVPAAAKAQHAAWPALTTWTFLDDGTMDRESIDGHGNYIIETAAGKHVDHGTIVRKGSKLCHTSAMNDDGEQCWTVRQVGIGRSTTAVSDKGNKLRVTRVSYRRLHLPK